MNLEDKDDFLGRWIEGSLSEEERKAFESSDDYKVYQKILEGSTAFSSGSFDVENSLKATKNRLGKKNKSIQRPMIPIWSVAAAVLLLFISYFIYTNPNTRETGFGELAEEVLPDGSKVRLNAKTAIEFQANKWEDHRKINLEGEAFFEVAKGAIFTVASLNGEVQVLGTKFNVYSRENTFEVRCFEGKVKVSGIEERYLTAGQSYRQIEGIVEPIQQMNEETPEWIDNESVFKNSPAGSVLLELSNQYGLVFEGNIPSDSTRVTVSFPNDNQELAIDLVFKSMQKSYQRESERVIFID